MTITTVFFKGLTPGTGIINMVSVQNAFMFKLIKTAFTRAIRFFV